MMTPLPSLSQIYSLLIQEERQRQVKTSSHFQYEGTSFSANTSGNNSRFVRSRRTDNRRSQLFCDHCKRSGHTIDKCYKIHGCPVTNNSTGNKGGEVHATIDKATEVQTMLGVKMKVHQLKQLTPKQQLYMLPKFLD